MDLTGKKTPKAQDKEGHTALLRRLALILVFGYVAAVVLFYFLAGEQRHLRQSRGNVELPAADSGTVELSSGSVVEQRFTTEIQRLERIDTQWGTCYRPNAGIVLVDLRSGAALLSQSFDAAGIPEGGLTTLTAETPIEGLYQAPLLLRLTADSQPGSAVSPLMDTRGQEEDWELSLNGVPTAGVLCFALSGTDYIWTGLHYWQFAAVGLALILLFITAVWLRVRSGKRSYVVNAVIAVQKYRFLIRQLVARDFKTKYKRSILGVFWSFLNPLMTMAISADLWYGVSLQEARRMRNTLEDFYYGNIVPHEQNMVPSSELRRAVDRVTLCEKQLEELLDETGRTILTRFTRSQQEINDITALENFILGFRLGVRIMAECMDGNDGDIRNGGE